MATGVLEVSEKRIQAQLFAYEAGADSRNCKVIHTQMNEKELGVHDVLLYIDQTAACNASLRSQQNILFPS